MEARAAGDYPRATALLEESLAQTRGLAQREHSRHGDLGFALSWGSRYTLLALALLEQGEYGRAGALCEECLALARERGDAEGIGIALLSLKDIARDQGDAKQIRALCEESLARFRELGQQWAIGFALHNLALAAYQDGDLALAASRVAECEILFRDIEAETRRAEMLAVRDTSRLRKVRWQRPRPAWSRRLRWPGRGDRASSWPPPWKSSGCSGCAKGMDSAGFSCLLPRQRCAGP